MPTNKTTETNASVSKYIEAINDDKRRADITAIIKLIETNTKLQPKMWGTAIVGFGSYHYTYESGRQGDAPLAGLASRANAIVFYLSSQFENREQLLQKFGKHKTAKACIYIQKLEDIDTDVLITMVKNSIKRVENLYSKK